MSIRGHKIRQSCRVVAALLAVITLGSCTDGSKTLNRRVTLSRRDDIPYGTQIAYEGLHHLFPDADISVSTNNNPIPISSSGGVKKACIIIASSLNMESSDVTMLMNFVGDGNVVFISANRISDTLLNNLSIRATQSSSFTMEPDSLTVGVYNPVDAQYHSFSYPGDSYDNWITKLDSQYATVLGRDGRDHPNFVRINYKGGGAIYLHFAPLAFSNFFLLHKQNMAYYANALSYMPNTVKEIIWDEYYRYSHNNRNFSALGYILRNDSLRLAFWLLLLLFAIIYLFESKRRQRQIPVIAPLRNTSLDFVRTIGRLYYQRRDNQNLATKMVVHFQDQVRTRYHLAATTLDEAFVDRLAYRTGYPKQELAPLIGYMQELSSKAYIADDELLHFHRQLEAFYKHT
jgi:hypothetical protein